MISSSDRESIKSKSFSDVNLLARWMRAFDGEGGLLELARSYKRFGLHLLSNGDISYREWAPSAKALSIVSAKT